MPSNGRPDGTTKSLRTFDCWVVFVHEMTLDQLDCEATLSHTTTTDNHQLVFPKELETLVSMASRQWSDNGEAPNVLLKPLRD